MSSRPKARMFYAVWPDATVADMLGPLASEIAAGDGRPQRAANFHLTLAFLGAVHLDRLDDLEAIGRAAASAVAPFDLALDCTGSFRGTGIVWLGASQPSPAVQSLAEHLREGLEAHGFPVEHRAFQPHVTLVRSARPSVRLTLAEPIVWAVDRLVLNASEQSPSGSRYREMTGWSLEGTAD